MREIPLSCGVYTFDVRPEGTEIAKMSPNALEFICNLTKLAVDRARETGRVDAEEMARVHHHFVQLYATAAAANALGLDAELEEEPDHERLH